MGASVTGSESEVRQLEGYVKQAQSHLAAMKDLRDQAKKNGNYKNSCKNQRHGDKVGNVYDSKVWGAEDDLKKRKAQLADAKKRLAASKKK